MLKSKNFVKMHNIPKLLVIFFVMTKISWTQEPARAGSTTGSSITPINYFLFSPITEFETKNRHHHQRSMMSSSRQQQQQKDSKSSPGNSSLTTGNGGRTQLMMQPQGKSVVSLFQCLRLILSGLKVRSSLTRCSLALTLSDTIFLHQTAKKKNLP